jgi:hypothetical protein
MKCDVRKEIAIDCVLKGLGRKTSFHQQNVQPFEEEEFQFLNLKIPTKRLPNNLNHFSVQNKNSPFLYFRRNVSDVFKNRCGASAAAAAAAAACCLWSLDRPKRAPLLVCMWQCFK